MGQVMVCGIENGIRDPSSNSCQSCLCSLCFIAFRKSINLLLSYPANVKIVGQIEISCRGRAACLGEGKLCIETPCQLVIGQCNRVRLITPCVLQNYAKIL